VDRTLRIAVIGGGIGGLTAAVALCRCGFEAHVFEQAGLLRELGAGIGLSPNALKVLYALGLKDGLLSCGTAIDAIVGRDWTTKNELYRLPLKGINETRYGLTNLQIHRGDLLKLLAGAVSPSNIHLNMRCVDVASERDQAVLAFEDGTESKFDLVIGCDGIGSRVRAILHGPDTPRYTGNMCWRAVVAAENLPAPQPPDMNNWLGSGGHITTYYVRRGAVLNVLAVQETPSWREESWSIEATPPELLAAYPDVHPELRTVLEWTEHCFKWGLFDRDPLATWSRQRVTLLGDAAHPMLPFLGQGAAMAIEDAYVLARELARSGDVSSALRSYEAERIPRTARAQLTARARAKTLHMTSLKVRLNRLFRNWLDRWDPFKSSDLNMDWVYGYDPTNLRLSED
jgi:salicylate hydroxylase